MLTFVRNELTDNQIEAKLRVLEERFDREMRARGFDPAQAENVALPSALARLYAEREELREEMELRKSENGGQATDSRSPV
jgi:hypothetical protein